MTSANSPRREPAFSRISIFSFLSHAMYCFKCANTHFIKCVHHLPQLTHYKQSVSHCSIWSNIWYSLLSSPWGPVIPESPLLTPPTYLLTLFTVTRPQCGTVHSKMRSPCLCNHGYGYKRPLKQKTSTSDSETSRVFLLSTCFWHLTSLQ